MQGRLPKNPREEGLALTKYCVECGKETTITYKNICLQCQMKGEK